MRYTSKKNAISSHFHNMRGYGSDAYHHWLNFLGQKEIYNILHHTGGELSLLFTFLIQCLRESLKHAFYFCSWMPHWWMMVSNRYELEQIKSAACHYCWDGKKCVLHNWRLIKAHTNQRCIHPYTYVLLLIVYSIDFCSLHREIQELNWHNHLEWLCLRVLK